MKVLNYTPTDTRTSVADMKPGDVATVTTGVYGGEIVALFGVTATNTLVLVSLTNPRNYWLNPEEITTMKVNILPKGTKIDLEV